MLWLTSGVGLMDDNKVVELGEYKARRPDIVWECSCGEQKFYLLQDSGAAECSHCHRIVYFAIGDDRGEE